MPEREYDTVTGLLSGDHLVTATDLTRYIECRSSQSLVIPEFYNIAESVCDRHAESTPDALAYFVEHDSGIDRVTFGELRDHANALANTFVHLGLKRGDRVAIVLPIDASVPIVHIACWKMGLISCPMSALFGSDSLEYRFQNADVSLIVTDCERLPTIRKTSTRAHVMLIDGDEPGASNFWKAIKESSTQFETLQTRSDEPAFLNYTSGTTGDPKGVLAAHRSILGHIPSTDFSLSYPGEGGVQYSPADWAWLAGLTVLMTALHSKRAIATRTRTKFDALDTFRFLSEHKIEIVLLVPTMLRMMQAVPFAQRAQYPLCVHTVLSGAEPVGADLYRWVEEELGARLSEAFGQTECNLCIMNNSDIIPFRPGALGMAAPTYDVAIVDEAGNVLPAGEVGQIGVRKGHPVMMLGYWRNPEATRRKFAGEWMLTGDLASQDADGYFWLVGRSDDVITSSGYRIGPGEIEESLRKHPAVALAAVIGVPDPVRTEAIQAFVVLKEGFTESEDLAEEIKAFVRERLARHEVPRRISFVDSMPTTTTGKLMRRVLKEQELARMAELNSSV